MGEASASYLRFEGRVTDQASHDAIQEVFGHGLCNVNLDRVSDAFAVVMETRLLPDVALLRGRHGGVAASTRDVSLGADDLTLAWTCGNGKGYVAQRGVTVPNDHAIFFSCAERVRGEALSPLSHRNVRISRDRLMTLAPNAEQWLARPIAKDQPAFRLLQGYFDSIAFGEDSASPMLDQTMADHVTDLVALIVGANGDGRTIAVQRGATAAKLAMVKRWTLDRIDDSALSVGQAARAHGIGPRCIQKLFERDGDTFSEFVLTSRLDLARRRLEDSAWDHAPISSIAWQCGFNDLSYFNRSFRSEFGQTPSDVRAGIVHSD